MLEKALLIIALNLYIIYHLLLLFQVKLLSSIYVVVGSSISTILGTKVAASQLEEGGSVVNISSFAAVMAIHSASLYSTYKAALIQFTKSSASELAERDIRVNCIIPGVINTPMTADYISEHHDRLIKPIAMKRLGHPSEIASGVLFLTSDKASYITGDSIHITGGKYLTQL